MKDVAAFSRDTSKRDGRCYQCKACKAEYASAYGVAHYKEKKDYNDAYRAAHLEEEKLRNSAYRKANIEKVLARNAAWARANPEKVNPGRAAWAKNHPKESKAAHAAWRKANLAKCSALCARHRAAKLQATPAWSNQSAISEFYALAQLHKDYTGFEWHVDHRVPLQSKRVCGLHNEFNLRVILANANRSKGNYHWPDMWEQRA